MDEHGLLYKALEIGGDVISWLVGILMLGIGWNHNKLWKEIDEVNRKHDGCELKIEQMKLHVAENFTSKDEMKDIKQDLKEIKGDIKLLIKGGK